MLVRDLYELIGKLGLQRLVIVGSSLGGIMAMALATLCRKKIAAVVLNDISPRIEEGARQRIATYVGDPTPMPDWPAAMEHAKGILTLPAPPPGAVLGKGWCAAAMCAGMTGCCAPPGILPSPKPWASAARWNG